MLVPEFNEVGMSALIKALVQVLDLRDLTLVQKKRLPALIRIEIAALLNAGATSDTVIADEAVRRAKQKMLPTKIVARESNAARKIKGVSLAAALLLRTARRASSPDF
jgi:hypothetical protein